MWYEEVGKDAEYVVSTRVRIARNIAGMVFPHRMDQKQMQLLQKTVEQVAMKELHFLRLKDMDIITLMSLVEKHLISYELAQNKEAAMVTNADNSIVVMVGEEDHIRIQAFSSGFEIEDTYQKAKQIEEKLKLNYALNNKYGYITSCPTNLGSGVRISIMMHLPGLVKRNQMDKVVENVVGAGITVRGHFGENTAGYGDMFQFSNKGSFGIEDSVIISNLKQVIAYVMAQEEKARKALMSVNIAFEDSIFRAYGILKNARFLEYQEAIEALSKVKAGIELGVIKDIHYQTINKINNHCNTYSLKSYLKRDLDEYDENIERANYIRKELR